MQTAWEKVSVIAHMTAGNAAVLNGEAAETVPLTAIAGTATPEPVLIGEENLRSCMEKSTAIN